ncbi:MAG: transposase [Bryobacterales bacterium]
MRRQGGSPAVCWHKFHDLEQAHASQIAAEALRAHRRALRDRRRSAAARRRRGSASGKRGRSLCWRRYAWFCPLVDYRKSRRRRGRSIRAGTLAGAGALPRRRRTGDRQQRHAERALRAVALGRKNYLFAGSDSGGERAAACTA